MKHMTVRALQRGFRFFAVFIFSMVVCVLVTAAYIRNKSDMEYAQMEQIALISSNKVTDVLTKLLYRTQTLAALAIQYNGQIEDFERVAAIIRDDPSIRNVILAPGGVVANVFPLEGNEQVIGLDYFSEGEGNTEAVKAKKTGTLVLGGPFNLVQGGQALVGRFPVYLGDKNDEKNFWGIVSVTLNYPQALDGADLRQLETQGFAFEIWRMSPDTGVRQIIANSDYSYNKSSHYVEIPMPILNAEWYFRLSPIRAWYQFPETWIFLASGLLVSWLIASLVRHNGELMRMQAELRDLSDRDYLTKLLNRRGLFKSVKELIAGGTREFILCYIDLDKFKSVNDSYGHIVGDQTLIMFASVLEEQATDDYILSRVGGDEFILVFKKMISDDKITELFESVRRKLEKRVTSSSSLCIDVSFSVGKAVYPADGRDIDELIGHADSAMYKMKTAKPFFSVSQDVT